LAKESQLAKESLLAKVPLAKVPWLVPLKVPVGKVPLVHSCESPFGKRVPVGRPLGSNVPAGNLRKVEI